MHLSTIFEGFALAGCLAALQLVVDGLPTLTTVVVSCMKLLAELADGFVESECDNCFTTPRRYRPPPPPPHMDEQRLPSPQSPQSLGLDCW